MSLAAAVFLVSAIGVVYVLFGYPVLLNFWPRRYRERPPLAPRSFRSVSVILPVRNGEKWIEGKLQTLYALDYPQELVQIIVVSDGSTDATEEIVSRHAARVLLIKNPGRGKSAAINAALAHATGEILFMTDVRQPLDPAALRILVACFDDPKVGVASGELIIRKGNSTEEENVGLYWKYEKWIRKRHSQIDSVIGATGAIYAIRRDLAKPLPPDTLLDDVQLPLGAFFSGYRILFVEEARAYDIPTALDAEFHRKVRTLAGVYQTIGAFPQLLSPSNRMWVHFLSHKLGRLLLPFLLVAMFVSSLWLSPWLAGVQVAFYTVAFIDPIVPPSPVKKVTSLVRTFCVMMLSALFAASILFRPASSFWKTR